MAVTRFGGLDVNFTDYEKSRYVVVPVPYEETTTYMKGAINGPSAIIEASPNMEFYDEELDIIPAEAGIATLEEPYVEGGAEKMIDSVAELCAKAYADNKTPIVLGGEHTVSIGAVKAAKERFEDVTVLSLDAHTDLRNEYLGSRYNHACTIRRLLELADVVQSGVRSVSEEESELVKQRSDKIFYAKDMMKGLVSIDDIVSKLGEKVYVSIDLDALDSSIMPSVGTPEPGGLGWYEVLDILKSVADARKVVGFDVVELCPIPYNRAPDFTAAKLCYKLMGYIL